MLKTVLSIILLILWAVPLFAQSVDTAWVRTYNGRGNWQDVPCAIALDSAGNVYVTGESYGNGTSADYATIKYDSSGTELWIRRYNGSENSTDIPGGMVVDRLGSVYVTGASVTSRAKGVRSFDFVTIKYNASGKQLWISHYNGAASYQGYTTCIEMDPFGNVYVAGTGRDSDNKTDYVTIKYDSSGNQLWVRRYDYYGNSPNAARAIAVDSYGNAYVTGASEGSGTNADYATIKYYANGDTAWVRRYNALWNLDEVAVAIALDPSRNVCVTGYSDRGGSPDYVTIKYDSSGNELWVSRYNGSTNSRDRAYDMTLDGSGNVYVTGQTGLNYATVKYDPNGNQLWVRTYDGRGTGGDRAYAITINGSGHCLVTGYSGGRKTSLDYATVKYDSEGNELWVMRYDGLSNQLDGGRDIAVDNSDNVYVTGSSFGNGAEFDFATIKYVQFLRGDANHDDLVNIVDVVYMLNYVLKSGFAPEPIPQVGDVNCDAVGDIIDIIYLIHYLFKGGPAPCI